MNDTSDLIFLMAAMVLFSILVTNSNRIFVRNTVMNVESQVEYNGIAVGQSIIDEARSRAFDHVTVGSGSRIGDPDVIPPGMVPSGFTAPANLGPEAGEVYPNFNDFDDFDGLTLTRSTGLTDFDISVQVFYVNPATPTVPSAVQTTMKRMVVEISSDLMLNTITLSYNRSYF
jgi:hypothetical protein